MNESAQTDLSNERQTSKANIRYHDGSSRQATYQQQRAEHPMVRHKIVSIRDNMCRTAPKQAAQVIAVHFANIEQGSPARPAHTVQKQFSALGMPMCSNSDCNVIACTPIFHLRWQYLHAMIQSWPCLFCFTTFFPAPGLYVPGYLHPANRVELEPVLVSTDTSVEVAYFRPKALEIKQHRLNIDITT